MFGSIRILPASRLDDRSRIVLINRFDWRFWQERPRHGPCTKIGTLCGCSLTVEGRPVSQEKYAHIQVPPFVKDQHWRPMARSYTTHRDCRPLSSWKQMTEWLGHRNPRDVPREHLYVAILYNAAQPLDHCTCMCHRLHWSSLSSSCFFPPFLFLPLRSSLLFNATTRKALLYANRSDRVLTRMIHRNGTTHNFTDVSMQEITRKGCGYDHSNCTTTSAISLNNVECMRYLRYTMFDSPWLLILSSISPFSYVRIDTRVLFSLVSFPVLTIQS